MKPAAESVLWAGFYQIGLASSHHCWLSQPTTRTAEHTSLIQGKSSGYCWASPSLWPLGAYFPWKLFLFPISCGFRSLHFTFYWKSIWMRHLASKCFVGGGFGGGVNYLEWVQIFKGFSCELLSSPTFNQVTSQVVQRQKSAGVYVFSCCSCFSTLADLWS